MQALSITELVAARIAAKRVEDQAIAERRGLDAQLAALLKDPAKLEGTVSQAAGEYKLSVTYKVDRKVDTPKLQAAWDNLSAEQQATFSWKADVSVSALRKLEGANLMAVAKFIESKEASPSIKIELA